jgi:hypothetical protein
MEGETVREYKYLTFNELEPKPKTRQFEVKNKAYGTLLGYVNWYSPWRKYCFSTIPSSGLVFDAGCLADIQDFINSLMVERRVNR